MAQKGHAGSLEFQHYGEKGTPFADKDYGKGELRMRVIADAAAAGKDALAAKDLGGSAASLSGGEKSITSLILLSAIANVSQPPFRVIDEFDVVRGAGAVGGRARTHAQAAPRARRKKPHATRNTHRTHRTTQKHTGGGGRSTRTRRRGKSRCST